MDSIEVTIPQDMLDSGSETSESPSTDSPNSPAQKQNMLPWKIVCLVLVLLVTLGWVGIIALLILKEEWQLVLVAWLLLYAAVHFCYWYCRRNSSRTLSAQIRQRLVAHIRGAEAAEACNGDCPPSYDDLVKSEVPPPAYYSVVDESPKAKRFLKVQSLALPWFLKKKSLEQDAAKNSSSGDGVTTVLPPASAGGVASTSSSGSSQQSAGVPVWKSSESLNFDVSLTIDDDEEEAFELPSYQTLMRENMQPVMTPIHKALSSLPGTITPPPPYSPRKLETINESQQQNE